MMLNRPLTGWGLRNFTPLYQAKMNVWLGHPHNIFVMLLGEIGIPGTILFVGAAFLDFYTMPRTYRDDQYLSGALGMYLTYINLFVFLLRLIVALQGGGGGRRD
jgi:O-antigen ligase